jgi:soluble lytic murein transglycosylase-like protein
VKYLRFLQDTFKDDRLAVAAYNAGEGAVTKYNNVPPYPETQIYVAKISKRVAKTKKAPEKEKAPPVIAAKLAGGARDDKPVEPQYAPVRQYQDAQGRLYLTTQ